MAIENWLFQDVVPSETRDFELPCYQHNYMANRIDMGDRFFCHFGSFDLFWVCGTYQRHPTLYGYICEISQDWGPTQTTYSTIRTFYTCFFVRKKNSNDCAIQGLFILEAKVISVPCWYFLHFHCRFRILPSFLSCPCPRQVVCGCH